MERPLLPPSCIHEDLGGRGWEIITMPLLRVASSEGPRHSPANDIWGRRDPVALLEVGSAVSLQRRSEVGMGEVVSRHPGWLGGPV